MESVSLLEYKDALLQAAWETNVKYMATDDWGSSGRAEKPFVAIGVPFRKDADACKKRFVEAFNRMAGEPYLINVSPMSETAVTDYSHVFMYDGEWIDSVG